MALELKGLLLCETLEKVSRAGLKDSKEEELNPGAEGPFPGSVPPCLDAVFARLPTIVECGA